MVSFRRGYGWAVLFGLGLVLLAAAAWFIHVQPAESAAVQPRVLVEQAVHNLSSCLTCHPSTETDLIIYHRPHPDAALAADERTMPVAADLQARLDSQLLETGQRILDLPETDTESYQTVLNDYLQIYELSRSNPDQQVLLTSLDRLSRLEHVIRILEHQAAPYKWKPDTTRQPDKLDMAVLSSVPPPPNATLHHQLLILDERSSGQYGTALAVFAPARIVFDAYRRGPPASDFSVRFVWNTRLPSHDVQSRFSYVDNAHITTI